MKLLEHRSPRSFRPSLGPQNSSRIYLVLLMNLACFESDLLGCFLYFQLSHRRFLSYGVSHERLMMGQSRRKWLENNDKIALGAGGANSCKWDS